MRSTQSAIPPLKVILNVASLAAAPRAGGRSVETASRAGPSDGAGSVAEDEGLLRAFDLARAGLSQSVIAAALWAADALAGGSPDENTFPNRVRRRLERAKYHVAEACLKLASPF